MKFSDVWRFKARFGEQVSITKGLSLHRLGLLPTGLPCLHHVAGIFQENASHAMVDNVIVCPGSIGIYCQFQIILLSHCGIFLTHILMLNFTILYCTLPHQSGFTLRIGCILHYLGSSFIVTILNQKIDNFRQKDLTTKHVFVSTRPTEQTSLKKKK